MRNPPDLSVKDPSPIACHFRAPFMSQLNFFCVTIVIFLFHSCDMNSGWV